MTPLLPTTPVALAPLHCEHCGATDGDGCGQCPPANPSVQFLDGSQSAITRQTWSPGFTTGMATRGDGLRRIVFITDGRVHSDPWLRDSDSRVVVRLAREVGK